MSGRTSKLPIFEVEDDVVEALSGEGCGRLVLEAPTGSGKSTQVPQILRDRGVVGKDETVVVLQPRRIAARMLARRVAYERGGNVGEEVGHQIRFEKVAGARTRILYVTEGVLLRRLQRDPELKGIGAVVFDEFHERHFFGDVTLARCLGVQEEKRPDLKLVVMSATLGDDEALVTYLGEGARFVRSEGRTYPVDVRYVPLRERHTKGPASRRPGGREREVSVGEHVERVLRDWYEDSDGVATGHVLAFFPGTFEIRQAQRALESASWARGFRVLPLFGELSPKAQDAAVNPSREPKIVLATNVAETSLTIDGVRVVVDTGLERRSDFDVRRGIETLTIEKISRASADQRAGRAGRTGPGMCLRMWSEDDHGRREASTPAEIHRMDLSEAILSLKATGVKDVRGFRWFERPEEEAMELAMGWLKTLGALDRETEEMTELGWELSQLPLSPRYGRILLEAAWSGYLDFFALVAAATQTRPLFGGGKGRGGGGKAGKEYRQPGDTSDLQALWRAWCEAEALKFDGRRCDELGLNGAAAREMARVAKQFGDIVERRVKGKRQDNEPAGMEIGRVLLTGFPDRVCRRLSGTTLACGVVGDRRGELAKGSVASTRDTKLFVAGEMVEVEGKDVRVKLNQATRIEEKWLEEFFPGEIKVESGAIWDEPSRRVIYREERAFRGLVLERRQSGEPDEDESAEILCREVMSGVLNLKKWDDGVQQWVTRVNCLSEWMPELGMPAIGEDDKAFLVREVCRGARSYKEIKDREVRPVLKEWLSAEQAGALEEYAPERIDLPNGTSMKVRYEEGGKEPVASAVLQKLYDVTEQPTVAGGKVKCLVEVLAPNQRPVQLTGDLKGFWENSYPAIAKELKGRYPKHEWR
ncbi:MAG: ATP-dependent helicase HrpB [Verrucomicrobiota bacterium]